MSYIENALKMRQEMDDFLSTIPKGQKKKYLNLYKPWKNKTEYKIGDTIKHGGKLYECLVPHESMKPPKPPEWKEI
jgi:hypothetical protein